MDSLKMDTAILKVMFKIFAIAVAAICTILVASSTFAQIRHNPNEFNLGDPNQQVGSFEKQGLILTDKAPRRGREKRATTPGTPLLFSAENQQNLVDWHNDYRRRASPEASNMEYMTWDDELAGWAQEWTDSCYYEHGFPEAAKNERIGQNLWRGLVADLPDGSGPISSWWDEWQWYDYETDTCLPDKICGHYRQLVWDTSSKVGCARSFCAEGYDDLLNFTDNYIVACNYREQGNQVDIKPYETGTSCTRCTSGIMTCDNKLCRQCQDGATAAECSTTCEANCQNCATLNADCTCTCQPQFTGVDCSVPCGDYDAHCGVGWPAFTCSGLIPGFDFVLDMCPEMCGQCTPDDGSFVCDGPTTNHLTTTDMSTNKESTAETTTNNQQTTVGATTEQETLTTESTSINQVTTELISTEETSVDRITHLQMVTEGITIQEITTKPATTEGTAAERTTNQQRTVVATTGQETSAEATTRQPPTSEQLTTEGTTTEKTTNQQTTVVATTGQETSAKATTRQQPTSEQLTTEGTTTEKTTNQQKIEIDLCDATPCKNGGTCTFVDSTRTCRCPSTHQGVNCETEIDPCDAAPCQNRGTCSSSNSVYLCQCPNTHQGSNCEVAKSVCSVTECARRETCHPETNTCECSGNLVRRPNGRCTRPRTISIFIVVVIIDDITSFEDIINNPESPTALAIRQRIILMLYGIFRHRYGNLFYGIVINSWRLGSLEVDTDAMFIDPDNATSVQPPTPGEVAEVFTESISNGNTTYGITVDDSRTVASDKNECSNGTLNDCSQNAECTNTEGSYDCTCLHGYTDSSSTGLEAGTQCEVVADGLSGGAIVGLVVGSVSVVMVIVILSVCSLVAMRRIMYQRRLAAESPNKLGTMREARRPIDYGHYGDRYSMGDHRPDMEMGSAHRPGYDEGAYYSRAHDTDGFIRGYPATGKNGSAHGKHSWNHGDRGAGGLF